MKSSPVGIGICGICWGVGKIREAARWDAKPSYERCPYCNGYGLTNHRRYNVGPLTDVSRCEVCGTGSYAGQCYRATGNNPRSFHDQLARLTEQTRAGKVFWISRMPDGSRESLVNYLEASIDEAEDFAADPRVGAYNQREARLALQAAAKVRAGMPWWLAQGEVRLSSDPAMARVQRQYLWVNGYDLESMDDIDKKYVPEPPDVGPYNLRGFRPHQWLFTAWKLGWETRYSPEEYQPLREATVYPDPPEGPEVRIEQQWAQKWGRYDQERPHHLHIILRSIGATEQEDFLAYVRGVYPHGLPMSRYYDRLQRDVAECSEDIRRAQRDIGLWPR